MDGSDQRHHHSTVPMLQALPRCRVTRRARAHNGQTTTTVDKLGKELMNSMRASALVTRPRASTLRIAGVACVLVLTTLLILLAPDAARRRRLALADFVQRNMQASLEPPHMLSPDWGWIAWR